LQAFLQPLPTRLVRAGKSNQPETMLVVIFSAQLNAKKLKEKEKKLYGITLSMFGQTLFGRLTTELANTMLDEIAGSFSRDLKPRIWHFTLLTLFY